MGGPGPADAPPNPTQTTVVGAHLRYLPDPLANSGGRWYAEGSEIPTTARLAGKKTPVAFLSGRSTAESLRCGIIPWYQSGGSLVVSILTLEKKGGGGHVIVTVG